MIGLGNEHGACITGALWAKRGERDILREARNECEARDEGRRKNKACVDGYVPLFSQSPNPIIVYSVASYRPHLSHFLANM